MSRNALHHKAALAVLLTLALLGLGVASPAGAANATGPTNPRPATGLINPGTGLPAGILPVRQHPAPGSPSTTAGTSSARATATAPHLHYYGGPVVSNARVFSVLWGGGTYVNMDAYFTHITDSSYFTWLREYNTPRQRIGYGSFIGRTTITPPPPGLLGGSVDDSTIQTELAAEINAGHVPSPSLDSGGRSNTIYAVFFPSGTSVCAGSVPNQACSGTVGGFCAYHGAFLATVHGQTRDLRYEVLPYPDSNIVNGCSSPVAVSPVQVLQSYTSHELIETVTDPDVSLATGNGPPLGWYFNDPADPSNPNSGEIGDICVRVGNTDANIRLTDGRFYVAQTEWSNAQNACVVRDTAAFDRIAPTITSTGPSKLFQASRKLTATYLGRDGGSGIAEYDVQYRRAAWNGSFSGYTTLVSGTRSTSASLIGDPGYEYCFRERAHDRDGNFSHWSPPRCAVVPLDDRALHAVAGTPQRTGSSNAYFGTLTRTTAAGTRLRVVGARVDRIAVLVTTCPSCGRVGIYVNGSLWAVVNTASPTRRARVLLVPAAFGLRTATIMLKSLSSQQVLIDGLAIART